MLFTFKKIIPKILSIGLLFFIFFGSTPAVYGEDMPKNTLKVSFKGKTYDIPFIVNDVNAKSISGHAWTTQVTVDSKQTTISYMGLLAISNALTIDFGAVKLGEQIGVYQFENQQATSFFGVYLPSRKSNQAVYFENQKYNPKVQHGVFIDAAKKRWAIVIETSKVEITLANAEKFEGTFKLDLTFANQKEKATGVFVIYN